MTEFVLEEVIHKVYGILSSNVRIEFGRKDLMLFASMYYKDIWLGEELIEVYQDLELLEKSAKALEGVFMNSKYVGEFK